MKNVDYFLSKQVDLEKLNDTHNLIYQIKFRGFLKRWSHPLTQPFLLFPVYYTCYLLTKTDVEIYIGSYLKSRKEVDNEWGNVKVEIRIDKVLGFFRGVNLKVCFRSFINSDSFDDFSLKKGI